MTLLIKVALFFAIVAALAWFVRNYILTPTKEDEPNTPENDAQ